MLGLAVSARLVGGRGLSSRGCYHRGGPFDAVISAARRLLREPLDDRIESFLIERMPTIDAEFGDEVPGDLRHDLVRIPRVLVLGPRHDQRRTRADGRQHIVRVDHLRKAGHRFEQGDAGFFAAAGVEAADRATDAGEAAAWVDGGVVERGIAAVGVTGDADAACVQFGRVDQHAQCALGVVEALAHQRVAVEQAVTHGAVVLQPVVIVRLDAVDLAAAVLEREGVRCEHGETVTRERRAEGLERAAHEAGDFALAEVEFAVVLVEDHDAAVRGLRRGCEQERRNGVAFEAAVFDALPGVAVERGHVAALERDGHGRREAESLAQPCAGFVRHAVPPDVSGVSGFTHCTPVVRNRSARARRQ